MHFTAYFWFYGTSSSFCQQKKKKRNKNCFHSGSLTSYFNYINSRLQSVALFCFLTFLQFQLEMRGQHVGVWGITLELNSVSVFCEARHQREMFLLNTHSWQCRRSSKIRKVVPTLNTNQSAKRQWGPGLIYACNKLLYVYLSACSLEITAWSIDQGSNVWFQKEAWSNGREERESKVRLSESHGDTTPSWAGYCSPGTPTNLPVSRKVWLRSLTPDSQGRS